VLTFDDGNKSDIAFVAPLLERLGFGATFFVNRGQDGNGGPRLSWKDMRELHKLGFEIANHTLNHPNLVSLSADEVRRELASLTLLMGEHGVPRPVSMAYPGGHHDRKGVRVLTELNYQFARRGVDPEFPLTDYGSRGSHYDPRVDHPFLIPSAVVFGPDTNLDDLKFAVDGARDEKIAVLCYHGVPDVHRHCSTAPEVFREHMKYLKDRGCTVIAMCDLARYLDPNRRPADPYATVHDLFALRVYDPRCEYLVDPLGIDVRKPRFSWKLDSARPGQLQTAYQVLVASSLEKLTANGGDLWDSGKVDSDRSVNVPYEGRPLKSGQVAYWKVRAWNGKANDGRYAIPRYYDEQTVAALKEIRASKYSEPARFQMGLLESGDWQGTWLSHPDGKVSSPLLRKEIALGRHVRRATAFVAGVGYFELYVNGRRVGDHVLDPGTTYYHHDQNYDIDPRVLYVTHDVTSFLRGGRNAIGVMLGHGWYSAEDDVPGPPTHRLPYSECPHVRMQLLVELTDGTSKTIATDESWRVASGPVTYNDYSHGESYDARREQPGWSDSGFDDSRWIAPRVGGGPNGRLVAQMMEPIRVVQTLRPVSVTEIRHGVFVYDMGTNIGGWSRLRVRGERGTKVTLRHAGNVYADGSIDDRCNMSRVHPARQLDTYILKGDGVETWEPRFTLHGFRYVEVIGSPATPEILSVEGRFVRTSADSAGTFRCSDKLLNRIHDYVRQTFACCLQSQPQDAMDRAERVAWLGDPGMIAEDLMYNFNTAAFWAKWVEDIGDAQKPSGEVPFTCPNHWRGPRHGNYGWLPVWQTSYPLFVWYVYHFYGDERILAEHFDGLRALVEYFRANAKKDVLNGGLGDHMEPQPDGTSSSGPRRTPNSLTSTAYYYYDTLILAKAAQVLRKEAEAKDYFALAQRIKAAFNREFFDTEANDYGSGSQTANALALYLGLVPDDRRDSVRKNLVHNIVEEHDGHRRHERLRTSAAGAWRIRGDVWHRDPDDLSELGAPGSQRRDNTVGDMARAVVDQPQPQHENVRELASVLLQASRRNRSGEPRLPRHHDTAACREAPQLGRGDRQHRARSD
jgi:alpha-L-rhamnosidase